MDHVQLKCFISVARTLSFSEAARRNYVSQSTVSRYIRDLEKEFGVRLFERTRRDVALTNEGKLLLPYAQEIIDSLNKATSVVNQLNSGTGGRLRIAYDATSAEYPAAYIAEFSAAYPDIKLDLELVSGSELSSALNSADCDFCFMMRDMLPESDNIVSVTTHTDSLSLLIPKSMPSESVRGSGLKSRKFVLLSESESPILYMEIMDIFRTFHFSPDSLTQYNDVRSVYMAVASGLGVSILPTRLLNTLSFSSVKAVELGGIETDLSYVLAGRKDNSNPAAQLFLNTAEKLSASPDEDEYVL